MKKQLPVSRISPYLIEITEINGYHKGKITIHPKCGKIKESSRVKIQDTSKKIQVL